MPISSTGRKLTIGPAWARLNRSARLPSWKTQTTIPMDAAMLSRKPATALIGTSTDRNTTISNSSASPTTTAMYFGSAADRRSAVSMFSAVVPVTKASMP